MSTGSASRVIVLPVNVFAKIYILPLTLRIRKSVDYSWILQSERVFSSSNYSPENFNLYYSDEIPSLSWILDFKFFIVSVNFTSKANVLGVLSINVLIKMNILSGSLRTRWSVDYSFIFKWISAIPYYINSPWKYNL